MCNLEEFIKASKKHHGDKYDYSQCGFIGTHKNIKLVCSQHGEFYQNALNHMNGHDCKKCSIETISRNKIEASKKKFFEEAPKIHKNKYNYSKVVFNGMDNLI